MRHFTVKDFANGCGAKYFGPEDVLEREITGVTMDSRKVEEGSLFVAAVGEKVDGHQFIPSVYEKGAICALSQQELEDPAGPYLLVEDTFQALKDAAEAYRRTLDIPVIGITGSVGKTSTKEMVASVLSQKYNVLKTPGNFNNEIGLPLTIFMIGEEHEIAILEMGMNHFGEMHRLSKIARPTHCLFTNIGVAHIEFLGSRDGILQAKSEMLDYASEDARIIVNGDDDKLITMKGKAFLYGQSSDYDVYADELKNLGLEGTRCRIHHGEKTVDVTVPLPGVHSVYNALAGASMGFLFGLSEKEIKDGIEAARAMKGRGEIIHTSHYTILNECYNANPVSMCATLDVLEYANTRKVAILGDMGELGENTPAMHRQVGEYLGKLHVDLLITIGSFSEDIHKAAVQAAPWTTCVHFPDKNAFFEKQDELLKDGDSILIKASLYRGGFAEVVQVLTTKE